MPSQYLAMMPQVAKGLPLRTWHDILHVHDRYIPGFESEENMQEAIPSTTIPGDPTMIAWVVEAPFSSVEVLEAILKPSEPFQIHRAKHIHRSCVTHANSAFAARLLPRHQRLYREYARFQGRLEKDREISFICVPSEAMVFIRDKVWRICWRLKLHYMSIPWCLGSRTILVHSWALVPRLRHGPGTPLTYQDRLQTLLQELGIPGCAFERSLLKPGTTPLPESAVDWIEGVPGTTVALPYFAEADDGEASVKSEEDESKEHDYKPNC